MLERRGAAEPLVYSSTRHSAFLFGYMLLLEKIMNLCYDNFGDVMEILYIFLYVLIGAIAIALLSFTLYSILKSPFKYPYHVITFDISGKRSPNVNDLIDNHLNKHGYNEFPQHYEIVKRWKEDCTEYIKKSSLKNLKSLTMAFLPASCAVILTPKTLPIPLR